MALLLSVLAPPPISPTPTNDNHVILGEWAGRGHVKMEMDTGVTFTPMLVFRYTTFCVMYL